MKKAKRLINLTFVVSFKDIVFIVKCKITKIILTYMILIIFKHYFVKIEKNDWFICQSQNLSVILHPNPIMWRQHIKYGGKNY